MPSYDHNLRLIFESVYNHTAESVLHHGSLPSTPAASSSSSPPPSGALSPAGAGDLARLAGLGVVLTLIILMTVVGNIFIIVAVFQDHYLRTTTNYFIVSLAVADLLLGGLVLPFSAVKELLGIWVFGREMCVFWCALDVLCCTASILNLVTISWDRYLAISRPLKYGRICTAKRTGIVIALVWCLAVAITIPPLFGWKRDVPHRYDECELTSGQGYVVYSACGSFFIPLVVMLFLYSRIYHVAVKHTKVLEKSQLMGEIREDVHVTNNHDSLTNNLTPCDGVDGDSTDDSEVNSVRQIKETQTTPAKTSSRSIMKLLRISTRRKPEHVKKRLRKFSKETKAAKTIAIVVGAFVCCWFPFFTMYLLRELCVRCVIPDLLFKCAFWLGYCNSFLNPIIYPCLNKDFKRAFKRIVRRLYCYRMDGPQYIPSRNVTKRRTGSVRVRFDIKTEVQTVTFERCPHSGSTL